MLEKSISHTKLERRKKMNVPEGITVKELFTEFAPKLAKEGIEQSGAAAELGGTEFSLVVDVSGEKYCYVVKNGTEFDVKEGDLDAPVVRISVSTEDIEKMIATNQLDMLLGIQSDLNRSKYNALQNIKGSMTAVLANDDGSYFTISATLNGAATPACTFKMKTTDSAALIKKEVNPVNLFMGGAMKIEGDMAFAMATQPLFT